MILNYGLMSACPMKNAYAKLPIVQTKSLSTAMEDEIQFGDSKIQKNWNALII